MDRFDLEQAIMNTSVEEEIEALIRAIRRDELDCKYVVRYLEAIKDTNGLMVTNAFEIFAELIGDGKIV